MTERNGARPETPRRLFGVCFHHGVPSGDKGPVLYHSLENKATKKAKNSGGRVGRAEWSGRSIGARRFWRGLRGAGRGGGGGGGLTHSRNPRSTRAPPPGLFNED